jgi:hypothetical protein
MKAHQLLIDNLSEARGSRDDHDSLVGLIVTFFSGICLEQNLGPDRARITKKIDAFKEWRLGPGAEPCSAGTAQEIS